uniref:penicillin-binding transpeptidase domain-containing protein n=1 Tax=Acidovorax sp. TaxID=1872122 RepID=UPI00262B08DE
GEQTSSLDASVQRLALQALQAQLAVLADQGAEDAAAVVLHNRSGEVLAYVGSSGRFSRAAQVDAAMAPRQAGSTLKPFLYALAFDQHLLSPASLLDDSPLALPTEAGLYTPRNYDHRHAGPVSVRRALASSMNIPAVRALQLTGVQAFHQQLRALGLDSLVHEAPHYGPSLALGAADVNLLQLTNAYRTLANGGRYSAVRWHVASDAPDLPVGQVLISPASAWLVGHILADNAARAGTFGFDSVLATPFWTAVKTGTSKDMRDNWAVGWSERYTVGVWVGNASGAAMHDVSGTSGAAPIWSAVMSFLHTREPSRAPKAPAGLLEARVQFGPGPAMGDMHAGAPEHRPPLEATRDEWFLQGTQQAFFAIDSIAEKAYPSRAEGQKSFKKLPVQTAEAPTGPARITAPAPGTIIALDPDIPPARQRLQFTATGEGLLWRMDGKPLGRGQRVAWLPWPGRHVVQITNAQGGVLDEIHIEVRGAGVAAGTAAAPIRSSAH